MLDRAAQLRRAASFLSDSLASLVMLHFAIANLGTKSCAPPNHLIEEPFSELPARMNAHSTFEFEPVEGAWNLNCDILRGARLGTRARADSSRKRLGIDMPQLPVSMQPEKHGHN